MVSKMKMTAPINIRTTDEQWSALLAKAREENMGISALVRRYIDEGLDRQELNDRLMARIIADYERIASDE